MTRTIVSSECSTATRKSPSSETVCAVAPPPPPPTKPPSANRGTAKRGCLSAGVLTPFRASKYSTPRRLTTAARMTYSPADNLAGIDGLLVGIVGFGVIGQAVAQAFHGLGARLCYHDPAPRDSQAAAALGARSVTLEELLQTSDVVTLHVPLVPATTGLIGERQLAAMRAGAVLINAARGGVVDEAALAAHLRSGHLGGAAVDVYSTDPKLTNFTLTVQVVK